MIEPSDRGQLRAEAADWFAVMRGPEASAHRADFEAWLARGALHRDAYNRISETFGLGKLLDRGPDDLSIVPRDGRTHPMRVVVPAIALGALLFAAGWLSRGPQEELSTPPAIETASDASRLQAAAAYTLSSRIGEVRRIGLSDGTLMILDTDSAASISYGASLRYVRLERGRARFDVAPDRRTFEVGAGAGTIVADGAQLDVGKEDDGGILVHVLRGAATVAPLPHDRSAMLAVPRSQLRAGEILNFGNTPSRLAVPMRSVVVDDWPSGSVEFDNASLHEIAATTNRYSPTHIVLADTRLADLRVSGTFRIDDPDLLARQLASLFDLSLARTPTNEILLKRRPK